MSFQQCNAIIHLGDDYGDNDITFRCGKPFGHAGSHGELGQSGGWDYCFTWSPSNTTSSRPPELAGLWDSEEDEMAAVTLAAAGD